LVTARQTAIPLFSDPAPLCLRLAEPGIANIQTNEPGAKRRARYTRRFRSYSVVRILETDGRVKWKEFPEDIQAVGAGIGHEDRHG